MIALLSRHFKTRTRFLFHVGISKIFCSNLTFLNVLKIYVEISLDYQSSGAPTLSYAMQWKEKIR